MPDQLHLSTPSAAPEPGAPDRETFRQRLRRPSVTPPSAPPRASPSVRTRPSSALSDPPYYTACPNPFLPEILQQWQEERRQTPPNWDCPRIPSPLPRPLMRAPPLRGEG